MKSWKFSLSTADDAPPEAPILLYGDVCGNLREAAALGYDAIEIHTRETALLDYQAIEETAGECGTRVSAVVTGRLNTEGRGNLVDDAPYVTGSTMDGMKAYIDMAERLSADIVVGWVKGNVPKGGKREKYLDRLARNLETLAEYGAAGNVKLYLEVINRYETNIFNTARETVGFIEKYHLENCYVHLDTFHMGIDENDPVAAIKLCRGKLGYMHFADNSRQYPGSGQFDFQKIIKALYEIGYDGYFSVECLPVPNGKIAAQRALAHLKKACREVLEEPQKAVTFS